ncbi:interleukin-10 receptor subunit beta isoform X1 [Sturnira hondurensis]|uniref:interleukin-10 receptor subunit beta isoform X1 n=1 Tax=Sturnira hondurensis TaxID=192404 RepID=UPI001879E3C6|nr:interleukin-10 receptor subunit beta isoform X1 [Sturnira hondurensis]
MALGRPQCRGIKGTQGRMPTALRALGAPRAGMARSLWSWLGSCLLVSALGMVPPPENVRMNSVNFKNILEWEPPVFPKGNLTFTAQYLSYRKFQDVCASTALTQCDFSGLSKYGNHTLRVRAERADEHSQWVTLIFCPVDDTDIGPPGIHVEAVADSLHIRFSAPRIEKEHETWTMRNIYDSWVYNVQYWKNGSDEKHTVACQRDFEVVGNLEPWTTYCVRVQGFLLDQNKAGEWSEPVCEQTSSAETAPSWIVVAAVLGAAVCATCLLLLGCSALLWCVYKRTKHIFSHGNALPQHLKEFLSQPHHNRLLFVSFPRSEDSEVFDKLSVVAELPKGGGQDAGDVCSLGPPSGWDPPAT